jgi:acyl carrier protein
MTINEFIEKFAEAVEVEDASALSANTEFRNLPEWGSLAYLSVIALMDMEFDVQIEMADFKKLKTIQEIFDACTKE